LTTLPSPRMRVAPPVQALSCSTGPWRSFQQALVALSTAVTTGWVGVQLGVVEGATLAGVALAMGLVAARWAGRRWAAPSRRLAWDGAAWQLPPEELTGQVALMIDLGDWMLVRFSPGSRWLPLSRREAATDWQALRVALHAAPSLRPGA
jgi:hypothetical protein